MENKTTFRDLWISESLLKSIEAKWYEYPSPIQAWVIPLLLKGDRDIIWQAQTWTWKTASFAIPLIERLDRKDSDVKAIILAPTRELAIQVAKEIESFDGGFKITLLYWWRNIRDDIRELKRKPQIIVWTPWRIQDHLNKWRLNLSQIEYFILDEADEMLNIGFKEEIEEIMKSTPKEKKVLLFSATMPRAILSIARNYMWEYDTVSIKAEHLTSKDIEQKYYEIAPRNKFDALCRVIDITEDFYWIIFCKTKMDTDEVASKLVEKWFKAEAIHWDIEQKWREKILSRFKKWWTKILVATDVAARWIDVEDLTHVINYSMPDNPETYTHRIWRTGRAGKKGTAISFVTRIEKRKIFFIEKVTKAKLTREELPKPSDLLDIKKKRLISDISEIIEEWDFEEFKGLSEKLSKLWTKENIIAAIIKKFCHKTLSKDSYKEIRQSSFSDNNRDNFSRGNPNEIRLFIAKWRKDSLAPWSLIQFIEKEVWLNIWDVGKINILDNFSYMNVWIEKWEIILEHFKRENKRRPLVVKAKERNGWGFNRWSNSGWYRWNNFRWKKNFYKKDNYRWNTRGRRD